MRPTFLLNSQLRAVSALVGRGETDGLCVGVSVDLFKDFETPHGKIPAGTKGFVDYIDPDTGAVWILMEGIEPALIHWDNMLVLVPFDTEELLECMVFAHRQMREKLCPKVAQLRTG